MRKRYLGLSGVAVLALTLMLVQILTAQAPAPQGGAPGGGQGGRGAGAPGGGGRGAGGGGRAGGGAPAAPAGPVSRRPDGKPNLTGFWNSAVRTNLNGARGAIVEPDGGVIPYKPEWAAKSKEMAATGMFHEPEAHCLPGGVPRNFGLQMGFQLVHGNDHLAFAWDTVGATRLIYIDPNRKHVPVEARMHQGDSVARWEGDVLVVDTTSQVGHTWFDVSGNIHSDQMHVVERFTPMDANTISYEVVVTDPVALTAPMKIVDTFRRNLSVPIGFRGRPTGYEQTETACVEGERDLARYTESGGGFAKDGVAGQNAPPGAVGAGRGGGGRGGAGGAAPGGAPRGGAPAGGAAPAGGGRGQQ